MMEFNLESFMPESLQLSQNTLPTRKMHSNPFTYYSDFVKQDPYKILKEGKYMEFNGSKTNSASEIQKFFNNKHIFITGGTGFVGKVLIEKLVRSTNVQHIYMLIRKKKGEKSQTRFKKLFEDKLFLRMKAEVRGYLDKIRVVEGDLAEEGLGLSLADRQLLIDNVHVVFHSAADVRFLEPLKNMIEFNVLGTRRVMELCSQLRDLKAVVHVSTAFSQCVRRTIEERVYSVTYDYKQILDILSSTPTTELDEVTHRLLQGWPNTYAFSKALTEDMIVKEGTHLPICIVRPSIVLSTYKEPVRGWIDNFYGPIGITTGAGMGVLHCMPVDEELSTDIVPVDFAANFIIAAAWRTGNYRLNTSDVSVYNYTATPRHEMLWKEFNQFLLYIKDLWPFEKTVWYTSYFSSSLQLYQFNHTLFHTLPGKIIDKLAVAMGQEARLEKIYKKMWTFRHQTAYFCGNAWFWSSDNVWQVWNSMSKIDKELFEFDVAVIDFKEYLLVCKLGVKYYLLNNKMENIPQAEKKNNRLYWLHKSFQVTFGFAALKLMAMASHYIPI